MSELMVGAAGAEWAIDVDQAGHRIAGMESESQREY